MISRVIRIFLFYQNPTCFFSAYFLKHHPDIKLTKHGDGKHHLIPSAWIGEIRDGKVILNKDSQEVKDTWIEA